VQLLAVLFRCRIHRRQAVDLFGEGEEGDEVELRVKSGGNVKERQVSLSSARGAGLEDPTQPAPTCAAVVSPVKKQRVKTHETNAVFGMVVKRRGERDERRRRDLLQLLCVFVYLFRILEHRHGHGA